VIAPLLFADLRYDPEAFAPVGVVTTGSLVLLARENLDVANAQQLVALAKQAPGKLTYASPGIGTPPHLTGEMFRLATGIEVTHVPYKGLAPALADLLAGRVDFMFDNLGNSLANIKAGRVKALGLAADARVPELPNVPTIPETYPGVRAASWFGVVAPRKTPPDVCSRIVVAGRRGEASGARSYARRFRTRRNGGAAERGARTLGERYASAFFTRSAVIGVSRKRTPVSAANALLIVGATTGVAICPAPVGGLSVDSTSICISGMSFIRIT
jgi:Tripartite tricarboxylate transporter family receptor